MTLPWSPQQVEWLQAMGLDVLQRNPSAGTHPAAPPWLARVAGGADIDALVGRHGLPRDIAARRAFWRALRPLRRAASG